MYFLFLFPFCNIENLVGDGRVKGDGGRREQKKRENLLKINKRKKTEGSAQPQTTSRIPKQGKCCWFVFCQDTGKKPKDSLQSVPSSPSSIPSAPLLLHGEACIVTVVGALFWLFLDLILFFAAVDHLPMGAQPPARPGAGPCCHLPVLLPAGLCCKRWGRLPPQPPSVPGGCDRCS